MDSLKEKCQKLIGKAGWVRYIFLTGFFYMIIYAGIGFMNAGNSYEQAVSFRLFCIGFGLLVLSMMEVKQWFSIWSLIYLPICYVFTHEAYERHWIADTCEYQFVDVIRQGKLVILIWGIVLIAIVRDLIKNRKIDLKQFHPLLGGLWIAFIVLLAIFKKGYFYAVFFVICTTSFYWVNARNDRRQLIWRTLQDAMILSFFYIIYKTLLHRPYDCERYTLYFVNANMAGMYIACVIAVLFTRIDFWWKKCGTQKKYIALIIPGYLLLGFACCLAVFNYTRTTIMGMGFAFIVMFILQLIKAPKKRMIFLEYGLVLVVIVALFQVTYLIIRYVPAYLNEPSYFSGEYNPETRIMKNDPIDSPKYTTLESFLTLALGKWGIYVDLTEEGKAEGSEVVIDTERDVTNGRTDIWKAYLSRTNWTGHYPGHITMDSGYFCYHAHSTYFHILYQYGIPTGIVYALMVFCSFIIAVRRYLQKGMEEGCHYLMLAVLIIGINLVGQITEWMGHPAYVICMMLFMMYGMMLSERNEKAEQK